MVFFRKTPTFPSWASLIVFPVDVVLRRLLPPNVLRPLIRLASPPAPWAGPPAGPAAIAPVAAGLTMWPSSSVTKKVDHMLPEEQKKRTQTTQTGSISTAELPLIGPFSRRQVDAIQKEILTRQQNQSSGIVSHKAAGEMLRKEKGRKFKPGGVLRNSKSWPRLQCEAAGVSFSQEHVREKMVPLTTNGKQMNKSFS